MNPLSLFMAGEPAAFSWLAYTTLGASALILASFLLRAFCGRWLPTGALYALGGIILVRLALPFTPESPLSLFDGRPKTVALDLETALTTPILEISPADLPRVVDAAGSTMSLSGLAEPQAVPQMSSSWLAPAIGWLVPMWLSVAALLAAISVWRYFRLRRWLRCQPRLAQPDILKLVESCRHQAGLRRAVQVRVVDRLRSPAVFGILRPAIIIPEALLAQLSAEELRHLFLHELIHIRRRDSLVSVVALAARIGHWFNPLVWISMRQFMGDREVLCDQAALKCLGPHQSRAYGETLLRVITLAPPRQSAGLIPFLTNKTELKRRLTMITKTKSTTGLHGAFGVIAASTLTVLTFTLVAAPVHDRHHRDGERPPTEARDREPRHDREHAKEAERKPALGHPVKAERHANHPQAEKKRDPHPEAKRPLEAAKSDIASVQQRRHELERTLKSSVNELKELRAAGKEQEAARMKERVVKLESELARLPKLTDAQERMIGRAREMERPPKSEPAGLDRRMSPHPGDDRGPAPHQIAEMHRRLHHLQAAVENLRAAGLHEPAERLAHEAEQMRQHLRATPPPGLHGRPQPRGPEAHSRPEPPRRPDGPPPMHAAREMEQLQAELQELRQTVRQLRARVEELSHERR